MDDSAKTDPPTIPTVDLHAHDALDAGPAAAFAPDPVPAIPARGKAAESIRDLTRVQLRDPVEEQEPQIKKAQYSEIPKCNEPGSRYELHGEIARGGMGAVLKGHDTELGRAVAVKVLLERHGGKPELLQRFIEEAQIAGQLQHPGIVPVYEMGQLPDKRPYFSMKLVKGQTLARLLMLRKNTRTDRPRYLKIFEQICQTLAYAHARGVIHRDLKPSNVMVGPFGEVQVMDWGLAKVLDREVVGEESDHGRHKEKVSVIRTRRSDHLEAAQCEGTNTQPGCILGTMGYMPPEQALGEVERLDARCDVFGLGAVLCEILTARPPYVAHDTAHLLRKSTRADLADAFGRLDACYADADLVRLVKRCLDPEPKNRPADAGVLAKEFTAYLESVDARLRQAELASAEARAKTLEERKRRKVQLALAVAIFFLLSGGAIAGLWYQKDQSVKSAQEDRNRAEAKALVLEVEGLLTNADEQMKAERWSEARVLLERAGGRLAGGGPETLQNRVAQARKDVDLIAELEEIRLRQSSLKEGTFDLEAADPLYAAAFQKYGLDLEQIPLSEAVAYLRSSAIREPLLAAIYNWPLVDRRQYQQRQQILEQADDDPWRRDFRRLLNKKDTESLRALVRRPETLRQPPALLSLLGTELLATMPDEAIRVYRQAQRLHPGDFWLNQQLGKALSKKETSEEAIRYLTAAVALRPESAGTRLGLGNAFREKGDLDGAIAAYEGAIACDRLYTMAYNNLGVTLRDKEDFDGAIACYRKALAIDPKHFRAHNNYAAALREKGELTSALASCLKSIELAPSYAAARMNLGLILKAKGDLDGALESYEKCLSLDAKFPQLHYNLGNLWRLKGDSAKAIDYYQKAIDNDPKDAKPHHNLGVILRGKRDFEGAIASYRKAILLDPTYALAYLSLGNALADNKDLDSAIVAYRRALEINPKYTEAHRNLGVTFSDKNDFEEAILSFRAALALEPKDVASLYNLGNALRDKGDLMGAAGAFRAAIEIDPKCAEASCNLARVLQKQGRYVEALAMMQRGHELGSSKPDWRNPSAQWVAQLRRLAQAEEKLFAFQKGEYQPKANRDRLALSEVCANRKMYYSSYRLLTESFAAEPKLEVDARAPLRYDAACFAVLVADRQGIDVPSSLDEKERVRLRSQALEWLRAELILRDKQASGDKPAERALGLARLRNCLKDHDFESVREEEALEELPEAEQKAWLQFWSDVEEVLRKRRGAK